MIMHTLLSGTSTARQRLGVRQSSAAFGAAPETARGDRIIAASRSSEEKAAEDCRTPGPRGKSRLLGVAVMLWMAAGGIGFAATTSSGEMRAMKFRASTAADAVRWQQAAREKLFALMMGGAKPERVPLAPTLLRTLDETTNRFVLEELSIQTLPDRRAHMWMALPRERRGKTGAILALHGHGGTGEEIVRGQSLYWYGRAFAEKGWVVISPDIGQHTLQHTNWSLMGERVWDALRCVDYVVTRPEVDPERLIVAGLSLGGETTMYVAALDERLKAADSSGWLTTIANMKRGHCPCWNFPGLEEHFDFADVFACVAPRSLVLEIGEQERAPGGFPVNVARAAFAEIQSAYQVFGAESRATLHVHPAGHVFDGGKFWGPADEVFGAAAR